MATKDTATIEGVEASSPPIKEYLTSKKSPHAVDLPT
jgi:hypothetical protein